MKSLRLWSRASTSQAGHIMALITMLTYPVTTRAAQRGFSGMKKFKSPASQNSECQAVKHEFVDIDNMVLAVLRICLSEGRLLALFL